jgi:hypothetical protein
VSVQLAVFLENRPGKLESVTKALAEAGVNIRGFSMASEGEYGVLKILADDPEKAFRVLKEHHYTVSRRTVEIALIDDRPGGLHELLTTLSSRDINIEDCYGVALEEGKRAAIVLDVERFPEAEAVLKENGIRLLGEREPL